MATRWLAHKLTSLRPPATLSQSLPPTVCSLPDPGGDKSCSEAEDEQPSTSTGVPRHGHRLRQQPDRYAAVHSISDSCQTASYWTPSILILVGLLLTVILAPQLDTAAAMTILLLTMVGLCNNGMLPFSHQVPVPPSNLGWSHHC